MTHWPGAWKSGTICGVTATQSAALLQHGALRTSVAEAVAGFDCECELEDGHYWARRNIGLRVVEGRDPGADARMGGRATAIWYSRERGGARGGNDSPLSPVAG